MLLRNGLNQKSGHSTLEHGTRSPLMGSLLNPVDRRRAQKKLEPVATPAQTVNVLT